MNTEYDRFLNHNDLPEPARQGVLYQFSLRRLNISDAAFAFDHIVRAHQAARMKGQVVPVAEAELKITQFLLDIQSDPSAPSSEQAMEIERDDGYIVEAFKNLHVAQQ
ncbi:hypothetical protein CYLTODRAFT_427177 [Cylindrobasidium torrendii FP15055 ss-10]|uniref:Uncharacterized protein n=1 Tax=Cylindrobasidium torrendii FP15055 ss-10 TaxID=1314674 RepID=A0A0D7AXS6_9AGAR|nr:hypothetical protein CYLTODRAFT_427177 [Cylindrobasidium torrendii FP15055 ss-10]